MSAYPSSGKRACGVSVLVRVRPMRAELREVESGWDVARPGSEAQGPDQDAVFVERGGCEMRFPFDHVISEATTTREMYDSCISGPIIQSCMAGFNATVFAYGQTGSGKSFTMLGEAQSTGVVPLAVDEVFAIIDEQHGQGRDYAVKCSMIEIYNEDIRDLISDPDQPPRQLRILESPLRGVYVDGVVRRAVTSRRQFMEFIHKEAEARRVTGSTQMNERSSRSHCIVRLDVEQWERIDAPGEASMDTSGGSVGTSDADASRDAGAAHGAGDSIKMSALHLVDLAGSERVARSGASGMRKTEGSNINKSLLFLGTVIEKLTDPQRRGHIPYRDSKLTRILQTSLGGNSVTMVIAAVTVAEQHREETRGCLSFASRAMRVRNVVHKNEVGDDKTRIRQLERQVKSLRQGLVAKQLSIFAQRLRLRDMTLHGRSQGEFDQMTAMVQQLQTTNAKLRRELSEVGGGAAHVGALEAEAAQLRAQVGEMRQERDEAVEEAAQLQEEQETLESLCRELEEDNDAKGAKGDRLRAEKKELERRVAELQDEVAERDRRLSAMHQERQARQAEHERDVERARTQNDEGLRAEVAAARGKLLELEQRHSALLDLFAKEKHAHRQAEGQHAEERREQEAASTEVRAQCAEQAALCRRLLAVGDLVRRAQDGGGGDDDGAGAERDAAAAAAEGLVREREVDQAVRALQGFVSARSARPPAICVAAAAAGADDGGGAARATGAGNPATTPPGTSRLSARLPTAVAEDARDPVPKVRIKGMMPVDDGADGSGGEEDMPVVRVKGLKPVTPTAPPFPDAAALGADATAAAASDAVAAYQHRVRQLEDALALRDSQRDVIIDTKLKRMQDLVIRLYNTQLNLQSAVGKLSEESRQLKTWIGVRKLTQKLPANLREETPTGKELIQAAQSRPIRDHHLWR